MRDLIKKYLERGVSRRRFLSGLGAAGISSIAATSMARSLAPFQARAAEAATEGMPSWMRSMRGTGGELLVAQLRAAGIQHIFLNPSSGGAPIFDALVDAPDLHPIKALQEGALAAMADGYAKASGKTPFVFMSKRGLPNFMTQMFNSWKDNVPMVVTIDGPGVESMAQNTASDIDHGEEMAGPITKWHWKVETTGKIPELTRRALKFASTRPSGPVFLAYPQNALRGKAEATVMDQSKFDIPMKIRPDAAQVEKAARLLLEARNPLLYVGDEIAWCGAQKEVLELAELLALPVTQPRGSLGWSIPFPTRNPLFLGDHHKDMRYPGKVDVMLNLGSRMPFAGASPKVSPRVKLIQVRMDTVDLARTYPTDLPIVADLKLATADLLDAIRSMATAGRLQKIRESRYSKTKEFTSQMRQFQQSIARKRANRTPVSVERLGMELESVLEKDTCFVAEIASGRTMETLMSFGGDDKQYFSNSGRALGWGLPAAFGVKLALPDRPVVGIMGDGAFCFAGPTPLWSYARYRAPVTLIVLNNRSYNNERSGMMGRGGRMFQTGQDMVCYMGDPDIDYAKMAVTFGVEGEAVREPSTLRAALERAKRANVEGRPYLLDVHSARHGVGATSNWHPGYSIEALRTRKV